MLPEHSNVRMKVGRKKKEMKTEQEDVKVFTVYEKTEWISNWQIIHNKHAHTQDTERSVMKSPQVIDCKGEHIYKIGGNVEKYIFKQEL